MTTKNERNLIMKKSILAGLCALASLCGGATELFFYSPEDGSGGLRFAVREGDGEWQSMKVMAENLSLSTFFRTETFPA